MKYISLDLETTGLDPKQDQILMMSMVVEDTDHPEIPVEELPHLTLFVKHDRISGNPYALGLNGWILDIISGRNKEYSGYRVVASTALYTWMEDFIVQHFGNDRANVAGKNVAGFDMQFLPESVRNMFRHRVIDPSMAFVDWNRTAMPSLDECKKKAGINTPVAHDAREDAMDVIRLLRTQYKKG